jgi:O-antigen/teichoic acid export membrane protein
MKETALRFITVVLLLLLLNNYLIKSFDSFLIFYCLQFFLLFFILFFYLKNKDEVHFYFGISRVTKKFWKKMVSMQMLIYSGFIIITLTQVIDAFTLGAKKGQDTVGDFTIAQYGASLVYIPCKAMMGGSIGILTQAWKEKNMNDVLLTGGGIIPEEDMQQLSEMGVGKLFAPGTTTTEIADYIKACVKEKRNF